MSVFFAVTFLALILAVLLQWQRRSAALRPRILGDVLLVFAHPDDEAMFFSPMLEHLKRYDVKVHFLCLSNGNYEGLGALREKELGLSAQFMGVHRNNVKIVNHPALQDGMNKMWDAGLIRQEVLLYLQKARNVRTVVTFDQWGVSHHPNHIATHNGVSLVKENMPPGIVFLSLRTRSLLGKYSGVLAAVQYITNFSLLGHQHRFVFLVPPISFLTSFLAMRLHRSQLVWFRYLFLAFSSYTYVNELEELKAS
ncbi:putative N-Acetyl-D-glucosaminylphosphatidylinositol de-N-acetylase [Trypanosoma cruzi]|uniref:N-acetylglucosaminylphosphatidylinositol deacetylase n=2 Tax=Trypanosoma cruzi TaxID=5693 RepID=Q4D1W0_TRYCC|nr:N-acetylglucosaminyl-phosphatidylinositol-deacetylase, putative [Trypanosoma cruzi]EAN86511.1 N-acetylglucosaminyl-phosphatidylinositol-deacetylase, putative [Trypanosoma cruzi]PWV09830.1 putative N-Acetyl-D-glucosaminylphosphatidylinositol de-N-acetylase [Trypanosoma cruzi]RNC42404.1 N-acetylglucosaminyl-phosphatidylinositol-deacetylase [Trypanosoma cruzi]|eukprot:XP_808362.1 N-acetylglucosaminyl-phosphatidylinositol-deacetylase [Trypanosoma cruzi strain CL Brener]